MHRICRLEHQLDSPAHPTPSHHHHQQQCAGTAEDQHPVDVLRKLYNGKIAPLENISQFNTFYQTYPFDSNLSKLAVSRPIVLVLGQYSTGKTSLINYLLKKPYPGQVVSPEPTTDSFVVIQRGIGGIVPGQVLASSANKDMPFGELATFAGEAFLNRFRGVAVASDILDGITIIDTPGILSGGGGGNNNSWDREYDFIKVVDWFIQKAHRVLVIFDAYKLDVSVEMSQVLGILKNHQHKTRLVLNKSDAIPPHELLRVYGALLWRLGKLWSAPEVVRAYVVSLWDKPIKPHSHSIGKWLLSEENELIQDLSTLHLSASGEIVRRFSKRIRELRAHILVLERVYKRLPGFFSSLMYGASKSTQFEANMERFLDLDYRHVMDHCGVLISELPPKATYLQFLRSYGKNLHSLYPGTKSLTIIESVYVNEMKEVSKLLQNISGRLLPPHQSSSITSFDSDTAAKRLPSQKPMN